MSIVRIIDIARIDAGDRLRTLDPAWVMLLAEEIAADGLQTPIRVVARGSTYKLVDGARRLAAVLSLGRAEIEARVEPAEALADDAAVRLGEIKGNLLRGDLTVLDRARYLAAWRDVHETIHPAAKRGRRPLKPEPAALEEMTAQCAKIFTDAAKAALGFSQRSLYLLLNIATIEADLAVRIALHPIADKRGELLLLADLSPARQRAVVAMLTSDPSEAAGVAEALALLDSVPAPKKVPVYQRLYETFSALKREEQECFLDLHAPQIEVWFEKRRGLRSDAA